MRLDERSRMRETFDYWKTNTKQKRENEGQPVSQYEINNLISGLSDPFDN